MSEQVVTIDGSHLTIDEVARVARSRASVILAHEAQKRVQDAFETIGRLVAMGTRVYSINTGVGSLAERFVSPQEARRFSRNQVLCQTVGVGRPYPTEVVRAAMLIRANVLAKAHSGVRPEVIDLLLSALNHGVAPRVPSQGSLGSSGDLAPLSHIALVISEDPEGRDEMSGQAFFHGRLMTGAEAMRAAGLPRLVLGPKEGMALTNGDSFCTGLLALACLDTERLLHIAEIAAAMSLEALMGASGALEERLHAARLHPGQREVARRMRAHIAGSTLVDAAGRVQDAYSLRCMPQVVGPAWDLLAYAQQVVLRELNAASDNPLLFGEQVRSGGNFHGEPVGLTADYLKIALSEVGAISERRMFRLTSEHTNEGLPPMLVGSHGAAGLMTGMMALQYTAAALVHENQALASPDSIFSSPTAGGQEDLNANATTACRHLRESLENLCPILAIELILAAQALDLRMRLRPDLHPGSGVAAAHHAVRQHVPFLEADGPMSDAIETVASLLMSETFIKIDEES
jgi:histidine ammonia-lyase